MAYRILVADDEADIARLLQDLFTRQGYQVLAAAARRPWSSAPKSPTSSSWT